MSQLPVHTCDTLQLDPTLPFHIHVFQAENDPAQAPYPHRHDFYSIQYVIGGKGTHVIDFESHVVHPHTLYFVSPTQVHSLDLEQPLQGYSLMFTEEFLISSPSNIRSIHDFSFFHRVEQSLELRLNQEHTATLRELFDSIHREFQRKAADHASVLRAYLHILLVQIQRIYTSVFTERQSAQTSVLVRRFKQYVSEYCTKERAIQHYAHQLGVSENYLHTTIKSVTGRTPGQIIRQELVLESKRLLAHTDLTAAEISYQLHFEDPTYFGRFFKREAGVSPIHFRKTTQEKYQMIQG